MRTFAGTMGTGGGSARTTSRPTSESLSALSVEALGDVLVEMHRQRAVLDADIDRAVACFDARRGYAASGAVDTAAWLRQRCRLFGGAALDRVRVARATTRLPAMSEALSEGTISHEHAAVIARAAEDAGVALAKKMEPALVEAATVMDPGRLRVAARLLHGRLDEAGLLDADAQDHVRRYVHLGQRLDGMYSLDGLLDAEAGSRLEAALSHAMGPRAAKDQRTAAQRRADALVQIAAGEPARDQAGLTIAADLNTLRGEPGAPAAMLNGKTPIAHETLMRLSCDANLTLVVVDAAGNPLYQGRRSRTVTPAQRRAVEMRDAGCRFPDCDRGLDWCDVHHIRHWSRGGKTNVDNLVMLCRRHHRLVHEEGWRLIREGDGRFVALRPKPPPATRN